MKLHNLLLTIAAATALFTSAQSSPRLSPVVSPEVPTSITFCGQKVDLDPVDMWERLDRELTGLSFSHTNTLLTIKRANKLFPVLAPILKKNGVPNDMLYLACVESTLNPRAYSGAKAAGLWQFLAGTAKDYGLEVNDYVDERYNTEKATEAACRYLKKAYEKYGNWESVAASYNGGMARISRELESQLANSAFDLYLADETSRYMFRIMALKLIMENPRAYGFTMTSSQLQQPVEYRTVTVNTPVEDWPSWAKSQGIDFMTLREHNPWIRAKSLPNKTGKSYQVKIPTKESLSRSKQKKTVYNPAWVTD
ncbi:MAG: lytic transglycosylase domain-containing protein [Lachnoclostridium sp.]|nr:lytic transglycosylase domain-containing protein [Lachnoclostridium sp.]